MLKINLKDEKLNVTKRKNNDSNLSNKDNQVLKKQKTNFKYQYGNYNRYYGYRVNDSRLEYFKEEWFQNKCVLDIGCNTGNITLNVAKNYNPKFIVGIDIDENLIKIANKNFKNFFDKSKDATDCNEYPTSFKLAYGNLDKNKSLPDNVKFKQEDYVPINIDQLNKTSKEYDMILALSITKWIHLNHGDDGLKRFFKKIYLNLNDDGLLLLEPQCWSSYKRKAKLSDSTWSNYKNIIFKPNEFKSYLTSNECGFRSCQVIGIPNNESKGFRRELMLLKK